MNICFPGQRITDNTSNVNIIIQNKQQNKIYVVFLYQILFNMAFPFLAAAGAAAAIPSIFQGISGISQANRGKKMLANNIRPNYQRPNEVNQGLALAEQAYANGVMPGTSQAINNISGSGAAMLGQATQAAGSSGDILDAITKINYNQGEQFSNLAAQQAAFKAQQLQAYQQQLANSAGYADKEFAYNKDQPYQQTRQEGLDLIGAGNQNIGGAVNGAASIGTSLLMSGASKKAVFDPVTGKMKYN